MLGVLGREVCVWLRSVCWAGAGDGCSIAVAVAVANPIGVSAVPAAVDGVVGRTGVEVECGVVAAACTNEVWAATIGCVRIVPIVGRKVGSFSSNNRITAFKSAEYSALNRLT